MLSQPHLDALPMPLHHAAAENERRRWWGLGERDTDRLTAAVGAGEGHRTVDKRR